MGDAKKKVESLMKSPEKNNYVGIVKLRMARQKKYLYNGERLNFPSKAVDFIRPLFHLADREMMVVVSLNTGLEPLAIEVAAVGGMDGCEIDIRKFRTALLKALKEKFRDIAVTLCNVYGSNDVVQEVICICPGGKDKDPMLRIYPKDYYRDYMLYGISFNRCVKRIVDMLMHMERGSILSQLEYRLKDWESIKTEIYPMLLPTKLNRKNLKGVVKRKLMDLSVVYAVNQKMGEDYGGYIKITEQMLDSYGVSVMELHRQAMLNMKMVGYIFGDLENMISLELRTEAKTGKPAFELQPSDNKPERLEWYVLTNPSREFGAVAILDLEFLKEQLGEKNYYILPSSIHEVIIVPAEEKVSWMALNRIVREVNESEVPKTEWLSDHCYLYDGKTGKLRSCA